MNVPNRGRRAPSVGYLAVLHDPQLGYTGGLLIVSASGRPLEFHCSTPLAVTRAQEILFGATLSAHVCGELIGGALVNAAKIKPTLLLVQHADAAPAAGLPVMLLAPAEETADTTDTTEAPAAGEEPPASPVPLTGFDEEAAAEVEELLATLDQHIELAEPFERVHEAVREAQRLSTPEAPSSVAA